MMYVLVSISTRNWTQIYSKVIFILEETDPFWHLFAVTPQDNVIYLVDTGLGGVMIRMNLRTLSYVIFPIDRLYHITTFDYDPVEGRIYFGDPVLKQILSINFHGEDPHLLRQFDPSNHSPLSTKPLVFTTLVITTIIHRSLCNHKCSPLLS